MPFSSAGLAVNDLVRGQPRTVLVVSGTGTSDMTGRACSPNAVHWTYDTYATASVVTHALVQQGFKTWFYIAADYAFGAALERDSTATVAALGGTVLGGVKNAAFASDHSSQLLAAQSSRAQVIGLANATTDLINLVKGAREFGLTRDGRQRLAALLVLITDVEVIGLQTAQGLYLASLFYWDLNERTRAFSDRFGVRMRGRKPTMLQAGVYSGLLHYFKSVREAGGVEAPAVMAAMKRSPTEDDAFGRGYVRNDGRKIHEFYLFQVKRPEESKGPWDDYKLIATVPGEGAFRTLEAGGCPLAR